MRGRVSTAERGLVDARLRAARPHLVLIVLLGPLLAAGATLLGNPLPYLVVPLVLVLAGAWYFRSRLMRPRRWPVAAAVLGGLAGLHLGAMALWPLSLVTGAALGTAGYFLAVDARRRVLEPYAPELADSRVEVPWQARGDRGLHLLVAHDRITLAGSRGRFRLVRPMVALSGVGAVEQILVARRATLEVPGVGELRVTVTPGPAVRITVPPGQWIVPTDHGREIARLVARRKELAGVDG